MESKQEKIVRLGYPFYSKNKVLINNFEKNDNKNLELLTTIFGIMVLISLSSHFILTSRSVFALEMDPISIPPLLNPNYPPVKPSAGAGKTLSPKGYRWLFTILGFFGSRVLGGELLWTPSQSMSTGYVIGYVMSWMIRFF